MTLNAVPDPKAVREVLEGLLGRTVEVEPTAAYGPAGTDAATFAVYVDDRLKVAAVAAADLELSSYLGAAIGLVPPAGAQAAIEDGYLSPMLGENLYEVLNVCASMLNAEGQPHVKLHSVHPAETTPPADVPAHAQALGSRLDLSVSVAGYGTGRLALVLAP